ncbi:MAG: hypothetical protein ACM3SW_12145 [Actinomycetota bacterium]
MKLKALLLIIALAGVTAFAQRGGMGPGGMGQGPGFKYDPSAETRLTGTIEEIKTIGACATHLVVKTEAGNTEVALGPSKFLKDQGLELNKGDQVEVTGVKTTMRRGDIFVTRQITVAGKTVNLRDEKGIPAWPRGTCR